MTSYDVNRRAEELKNRRIDEWITKPTEPVPPIPTVKEKPKKVKKTAADSISTEQSGPLDPLLEVNENVPSEVFDRPTEEFEFEEIPPRIFTLKDVQGGVTIESLNNAIYENGVVNLCWPEIIEPVFETRTCFPTSYYTNSAKERLLLAYAENFRRQFLFHYHLRKPLLLQAHNECGLQVGSLYVALARNRNRRQIVPLSKQRWHYLSFKKCFRRLVKKFVSTKFCRKWCARQSDRRSYATITLTPIRAWLRS